MLEIPLPIKNQMVELNDYTYAKLAEAIGVSRTTLWVHMKSPDDFTLRELRHIAQIFNITLNTLIGEKAA